MTGPSDSDVRKVTSLRELPQSIEPPHDLWRAIEARLGEIPSEGLAAEGARDALVLHALYGYSHGEAAQMLGVAEGTCKAQLHRARKLLRERLGMEVN